MTAERISLHRNIRMCIHACTYVYMHVYMCKRQAQCNEDYIWKKLGSCRRQVFSMALLKEHTAVNGAVEDCLQTRNICINIRLQPWQTCRYGGKNTRLNISELNALNPTSKSIFEQRSCCLEWYTHRQCGSCKHCYFRSGIKSKAKGQIPKRQCSVSHFSS